jgi:predicted DNA-binding protein
MKEPMALRLDGETRKKIVRIARRKGETVSGVIREAVAAWVEREESGEAPWKLVADLAGCVDGGDPDRSSRGGRRVAELLRARRR